MPSRASACWALAATAHGPCTVPPHDVQRPSSRLLTSEEFDSLLRTFDTAAIHLETRDAYGTSVELPHMAEWQAGKADDLAWMQDWCRTLRDHVDAGRSVRRARIVSEPLSEYQNWSHSIAQPMVDAGEDIRWVRRVLVSAIGIPGNDYYLFDDKLAVFLHYAGNGLATDRTASTEPAVLRLCRDAFEAVWKVSTRHHDYQPR